MKDTVFGFKCMGKLLVIRPGHADVNVIVPRDKALMSECAEICSVVDEIAYAVLIAELCDTLQQPELDLLGFIYGQFFHCRPFSPLFSDRASIVTSTTMSGVAGARIF